MSTITLPNIRVSSDLTVKLKLKDGGVALDWSTLQNIKVSIYSDAQRALAGRCSASIDAEDPTLLVCTYAANKPQYVGVNRVVVSAKYMGETKTYDKPAFNFVRWTDDQAGEQITIDDPDIDVEIEVEDVSSSILQAAIAAALQAAEDAEHAAHLVPLEVLQDCEQATQDANEAAAAANAAGITSVQVSVEDNEPGTPSAECSLANKVLSVIFHYLKGETGDAAGFGTITATCVEDGGDPSVLVTLSGPDTAKNIAFTLKNFKGDKGDKGDQGNTGSSVDYPFEIVNNCMTDDATKALSAAQGKALKDEVSQLEHKVDGIPSGTWETMDLSVVDRQNIFINSNNNKWNKGTGWYSKFLPIEPGKKYRVTAGAGGVTRYAFMTSDAYTLDATVTTYATGYSTPIRVEIGETTGDLIPPANAGYLFFLTEIGNGPTGVSVSEYHEEREGGLMERTAALEVDNETIKSDLYGTEGWEEINLSAITRVGYFINGVSGRWDNAAGWYCKFVPVIPNKMYRVTAGTDVTRFAFLTTDEFTPGTVCDTYAFGWSETVRIETGETSDVYYAPYNAGYMYLLTEIGSGDTGASVEYSAGDGLVERVESLEELCEGNIFPKIIVNEGVESTDGVYASLQDAVDAIDDGGEIIIEGDLHIDNTVTIPAGKAVKLTGGGLKGSMQSLGVRRKDTNGVAKVYIGDLKPQWIEVDGVAKYPASSLRDYPYKAAVTSSGSSNATVTVTITVPVADAVKLAAKGTTDVWITLLVEWMSAKLRIDSINTSTGVITCTFNQGVGSYHNWSGTKRIIVENIDIESATINGDEDTWAEGTFYYSGGYLYYKYNASESAPNIEIPAVETLISANGSLYMDGVEVTATAHDFDNLMGEGDGHGYRSFQSGFVINGAIEVNGQAEIRNCKFRHTTNNAIRVNSNANGVNIVNCDFNEVGCDAILVGECNYINYNKGTAQSYVSSSAPSNVTVKGNSIHHPGRIYQEASAIAVAYGTDFYVGSNVISDTYYTGISTGADWAATSTQINEGGIIEGNLLKNIGVGSCALSDGAAIYNLGNERGMVVTKNIITGIFGGKKGGQNLYAVFIDQGSKNITFSNNIVYDVYGFTSINISGSGSGISVKNNIFALPKSVVADQNENLPSCFANNIFAWSGSKTISQITTGTYVKNLYYRYDSALSSISFDTQAVIGNPGFRDVDNYDFTVTDTTKTSQAGFTPFTLNAPAASLVSRTDNTPEDAESLAEWISRWEDGSF